MEHLNETDDGEVLARLGAGAIRRGAAVGTTALLGALLLWLGAASAAAPAAGLLFALLGLGALALAEATRRATARRLVLTRQALAEEDGRVLAPLSAVRRVERGAFAFKPSSGFVLHLDEAVGPAAWAPGLWWRFGRRVGVGGALGGREAGAMAEFLALVAEERRGGQPV